MVEDAAQRGYDHPSFHMLKILFFFYRSNNGMPITLSLIVMVYHNSTSSVLNPLLFIIYVNDIHTRLRIQL